MPPTQGETETKDLPPGPATVPFGWPVGCDPLANPLNSTHGNCEYTWVITYPAGAFPTGSTASVTPNETSQADWTARTCSPTPFCGTQIAPVAGENGDGIIFSADCAGPGGSPCTTSNTEIYMVQNGWETSQPSYCESGPLFLKADPIGSDNWQDVLTSCQESPDPGAGTTGTTKCRPGTKCLSDWASGYDFHYTFNGFFSPVHNPPDLNVAKAGQAIPIQFQVLGLGGVPVTNLDLPPVSITFSPHACAALDTTTSTALPPVVTAGSSPFQNMGGGYYTFVWKTTGFTGCGQLQVNLGDGVLHVADFKFR